MASMLATLDRALVGVLKGWLDDHRVRLLLRGSLFATIVAAIALLAIDPNVPRFGGVVTMQQTPDAVLRDAALKFWLDNEQIGRARLFVWVDALVWAPLFAVFIATLLLHYDYLLRVDGTPPSLLRWRIPWKWLIALPLTAFAVNAADAAVTLYALWAAVGGVGLSPRLHKALHAVSWLAVWAWGIALLAAALLFASWFFKTEMVAGGGAYQRARLRSAIADMLWRSKYAIAILALYATLLLGMDQTRDALLRQVLDIAERPLPTLIGWVITIASLLLLARASWYWPRIILRLGWPDAVEVSDPQIEAFAKWWCRILGLVPLLLVAIVLARSMHDVRGDPRVVRWLAISIVLIVALAAYYLCRVTWRDRSGSAGYYGVATDVASATRDMTRTLTLWVAWGAPVLFLVARFAGLTGWTPPLALPVITCGLAAWAGVLGWIAYQSRRAAVPYVLIVVAIAGVFGILDYTDAHRVRAWTDGVAAFDATALRKLFAGTVVLAVFTAALAWFWSRPSTSATGRVASALVWLVAIALVLKVFDRNPGATAAATRPALDVAMRAWLEQLHVELKGRAGGDRVAVYVVSSEGGGMRSAYWTSSVLARLRSGIDGFDRRTFALAGVSGGAVGVAVDRGCSRASAGDAAGARACIDRFGHADLWTQLLGGLMFEDAIAMIVPTSWCRNPGCALLGRSYWFEGSMEAALPALATGLRETRPGEPHLFMTVTAVETGARSIQSDVAIDWAHFPAARDVASMMDADIRLSTAAHNSSRFPYTNPVGAVYGNKCKQQPSQRIALVGADKPPLCERLQDGGYFDDSATQTTADILRMMRRCLDAQCGGGPDFAAKAGDLRQWIKPVVITIRNEAKYKPGPAAELPCMNPSDPARNPAFPNERPPLTFYPSVISSPVTLYNTREAHLYAAEGELELEAKALWSELNLHGSDDAKICGTIDQWIGDMPYRRFDLVDDGTLYPSGWLLSRQAMTAMCKQAERIVPLKTATPSCEASATQR